jgi:hypothetical protein
MEIIFRCRPREGEGGGVIDLKPRSVEVKTVEWFEPDEFPQSLSDDQRQLIKRVLKDGVNPPN